MRIVSVDEFIEASITLGCSRLREGGAAKIHLSFLAHDSLLLTWNLQESK